MSCLYGLTMKYTERGEQVMVHGDKPVTSIRVKPETYAKIAKCGRFGESLDDVISRVFNYYIERELRVKK